MQNQFKLIIFQQFTQHEVDDLIRNAIDGYADDVSCGISPDMNRAARQRAAELFADGI